MGSWRGRLNGWNAFDAAQRPLLPGTMSAGFEGVCEMVVHLGGTARYIDDEGVVAVA